MKLLAIATLSALLTGLGAGWLARGVIAERDMAEVKSLHAQERERHAQAAQQAEAKARLTEQARVAAIERIEHETFTRTQAIQADAAAARRSADSLRNHIARLAGSGSAPSDTAAAPSSEAATGPGLVLTELFSRTLDRTVELAEYADRARTAGLACEAAYATLRQ